MNYFILTLVLLAGSVSSGKPRSKPPKAMYSGAGLVGNECARVSKKIDKLGTKDEDNPWELSGRFEGDILQDLGRNGLPDEMSRWPKGVIPYYIKKGQYTKKQELIILGAMREYHKKTCIRFRPYRKGDTNWLTIQAGCGCNSYVGMHTKGQIVNLHAPGCMQQGTIIHELMHATGFYHQQSAADRDKYVKIRFENLKPDTEHNFEKHLDSTTFGIGYDYESVMHYSTKAFSANGRPTIIPLDPKGWSIGQRKGFSVKDRLKIDAMYKQHCQSRTEAKTEFPEFKAHFDELVKESESED